MDRRVQRRGEIIPQNERTLISNRYHVVTKAVNQAFWNSDSELLHSLYVGSYGRGTAVSTSDIDILLELPKSEFNRFNSLTGNSQSRLLQAVRTAVKAVYPRSDIRADGQVVKINFSDGIIFELLPVFKSTNVWGQWDGKYIHADTNEGGSWETTNPKAEQDAMRMKNYETNGLLFDTCKHIRYIRDNHYSSYKLSGIVIDSFVYAAIGGWYWPKPGETSTTPGGTYEATLLDYFKQCTRWGKLSLKAPGSNDIIFADKDIYCLGKVLEYMAG